MDYRRYYIPDAIVFITQVVLDRKPIFANLDQVNLLRSTLHTVQEIHPFQMLGYVFLPDHFHILIKPGLAVTHSQIMHSLKPNFTKAYKKACGLAEATHFWQRRYWDHVICNQDDLEHHLHYIHYNPVKHGYVAKPEEWVNSSYCHWRQRGAYPDQWGWSLPKTAPNLQQNFGE